MWRCRTTSTRSEPTPNILGPRPRCRVPLTFVNGRTGWNRIGSEENRATPTREQAYGGDEDRGPGRTCEDRALRQSRIRSSVRTTSGSGSRASVSRTAPKGVRHFRLRWCGHERPTKSRARTGEALPLYGDSDGELNLDALANPPKLSAKASAQSRAVGEVEIVPRERWERWDVVGERLGFTASLASRQAPMRAREAIDCWRRAGAFDAGEGTRTLTPHEGTPDFKSGAYSQFRHPGGAKDSPGVRARRPPFSSRTWTEPSSAASRTRSRSPRDF
jgi:hypothetical protein